MAFLRIQGTRRTCTTCHNHRISACKRRRNRARSRRQSAAARTWHRSASPRRRDARVAWAAAVAERLEAAAVWVAHRNRKPCTCIGGNAPSPTSARTSSRTEPLSRQSRSRVCTPRVAAAAVAMAMDGRTGRLCTCTTFRNLRLCTTARRVPWWSRQIAEARMRRLCRSTGQRRLPK